MKRVFAALIALLAVFSLSACVMERGSVANNTESSWTVTVEDDRDLEEIAGPKTRKFFEDYNEEDGYTMRCTAHAAEVELTLLNVIKGDKSYVNVDRADGGYAVIVNGEDIYMLMHSAKTAYKMEPGSVKFGSYIQEANNMLYGSTYSEGKITIDGVEYESEDYKGPLGNVRYCFLEDKFGYIVVDRDTEYVAIKIADISKAVDESLFQVPEGYKVR